MNTSKNAPLFSYQAKWLPDELAATLLDYSLEKLNWQQHRVCVYGKTHPQPRLSCWIGDPGCRYRYSGLMLEPEPWPAHISQLRLLLRQEKGLDFNAVLVNLYRDGSDHMGWHSDDEKELGTNPVIASYSLGASRRFRYRKKGEHDRNGHIDLEHNSLLIMPAGMQAKWQHMLAKTAKPKGPRVNMTFRQIIPYPA